MRDGKHKTTSKDESMMVSPTPNLLTFGASVLQAVLGTNALGIADDFKTLPFIFRNGLLAAPLC